MNEYAIPLTEFEARVWDKIQRIHETLCFVPCGDGTYWMASPPPDEPGGVYHRFYEGTLNELERALDDEAAVARLKALLATIPMFITAGPAKKASPWARSGSDDGSKVCLICCSGESTESNPLLLDAGGYPYHSHCIDNAS